MRHHSLNLLRRPPCFFVLQSSPSAATYSGLVITSIVYRPTDDVFAHRERRHDSPPTAAVGLRTRKERPYTVRSARRRVQPQLCQAFKARQRDRARSRERFCFPKEFAGATLAVPSLTRWTLLSGRLFDGVRYRKDQKLIAGVHHFQLDVEHRMPTLFLNNVTGGLNVG